MADPKDSAKNKKSTDKKHEKPTGYKSGQGNIGAGRSGFENLGSEKPKNDQKIGSRSSGADQKSGALSIVQKQIRQ